MKVLTLNSESLDLHCENLYNKIRKSGFNPDLILGVKTGGAKIAEIIFSINKLENCKLDFCHPIRQSSLNKKNRFKNNLKSLPLPLLNILRIIEAKLLFKKKVRDNFFKIEFPEKITNYQKILIVDDAVDTGATLKEIIKIIKQNNPDSTIKTAVLAVTSKNPIYKPDFSIFNNHTLIRFPWSIDAK